MLSLIDYEKVDPMYFSLMQMISAFETTITNAPSIPGKAEFITALDEFRNNIALQIELIGRRD